MRTNSDDTDDDQQIVLLNTGSVFSRVWRRSIAIGLEGQKFVEDMWVMENANL